MTDIAIQGLDAPKTLFTSLRKIAAAAAIGLFAAACSGVPEPKGAAPDSAPGSYQLGAGDVVSLQVFEAAGLTTEELQTRLESQMAEYRRDAEVTVSVMEYRPFYILGEVKNPGGYPYVEGMSVVNAIAMAGGYTYRARKDNFLLQRDAGQQALRAGDGTPILPGDVITVRERYF